MVRDPMGVQAGQASDTTLFKLFCYTLLLIFMGVFCGTASAAYTTYEYDITGPLVAKVHVIQTWEHTKTISL